MPASDTTSTIAQHTPDSEHHPDNNNNDDDDDVTDDTGVEPGEPGFAPGTAAQYVDIIEAAPAAAAAGTRKSTPSIAAVNPLTYR